jgi:RimK family alpha-L-glutamate ligase
MEKFKSFITEAKEEPYELVVFNNSGDNIRDVGNSGLAKLIKLLDKSAENVGVKIHHIDFVGCYVTKKGGKTFLNSWSFNEDAEVIKPDEKADSAEYQKPIEINPERTIIMPRGLGTIGFTSSRAWVDMIRLFEEDGFKTVPSVDCWDVCSSKFYCDGLFRNAGLRTPKTVPVAYSDDAERAIKELGTKFPVIMKSSSGTQTGVGVVIVESMRSLHAIVQMTSLLMKNIDLVVQEYIETKYDVRVIVHNRKVIGSMKREVITGDVRSNVSLGAEASGFELTEIEEKDCLTAAGVVNGELVGVDFIPAKNREKEQPYMLEVNSMPGFGGIEEIEKGLTDNILSHYLNRDNWTLDKSTET